MDQSKTITICTHNGTFHSDEVMAYVILNELFSKNQLIRTRNIDLINQADICIDVGETYDPDHGRFDHHQQGFNHTFDAKSKLPLSSFGLVYKHYGLAFIKQIAKGQSFEPLVDYDKAYQNLYYYLVAEFDGHDNGIRQYSDNFYDQINNKQIQTNYNKNST